MPVRSGYGPSVSVGLSTHDPGVGVVVVPVPVDVPPLPVDGLVGDVDPQAAIAAPPTAVSAPRICRRLSRDLFVLCIQILYGPNRRVEHMSSSRHRTSRGVHNCGRRGRCFGEMDLMINFDLPDFANGTSERRMASLTSVLIAGLSRS